jgi:hypothetical protein
MSTRYNFFGGLVTDGLILNLDAAKLQSYPGTGTIWRDLSGRGNNGTLTNGPTLTGSGKNLAITFDGTNDYVDISASTFSSFGTNDFGISVWVNFNNLISNFYRDILGSSNNTAYLGTNKSGWVCSYYSNNEEFRFSYQSNNTWIFERGFSSRIIQSQWYCINYIRNSGIVTFYQNGSPVFSSTITTNLISTEPFIRLGGGYGSGGGLVNGLIPQTQIYNRALSQFEVFQNFNSMKGRYGIPDIVTDGLVLNLDAGNPYSYLQGSSGTTWTDVSDQGNNGTLINGASHSNGTMVFDGVDDYARVSDVNTASEISIEGWVYANSVGSFNAIASQFQADTLAESSWVLETVGSDIRLYITNNSLLSFASTSFSTLVWTYIVGTFNGTTIKIYKNSVLGGITGTIAGLNDSNLNINIGALYSQNGSEGGTGLWNGKIANVKIYNRALSQAEITQNFNATRGRYGV